VNALSVLDRKLVRELAHLRGQVFAIALVVAGGIAVCLVSLVNYASLSETRSHYYRQHGFADVFVDMTRAPRHLLADVRALDGVARAEVRVQTSLRLQVDGFADPVSGRVLSLPDQGEPGMHRLFLRVGRLPDARRADEVVVIGSFAEAHGLTPGDRIGAIINGRWQSLRVVGIAESPEFIYVIPPGSMLPDYHRYAILWMSEGALAAATDMQGAFNNVLVSLQPGAVQQTVIDQLDQIFRRYGSTGAYGRDDHGSDRFLSEELNQLRTMALLFPAIFMSVAVFLINVVVGRLVSTQRDVIAVLKAFGYSNLQVGMHFGKLVSLIMLLGILLGVAGGLWLAREMTAIYVEYFRFPDLLFEVPPGLTALVLVVGWLAGLIGARGALVRAFRLSPAAAMGPEPPPVYRRTRLERALGMIRFSQPSRMILRNIERRPLRSLMSMVGVAMATAIIVLGTFQFASINLIVHSQFARVQQEDMTVTLMQPRTDRAVHEIARLPGVRAVERSLAVPVRLRVGHRSWRVGLVGLQADAQLSFRVDTGLNRIPLPASGVLLTEFLLEALEVRPGDRITVEWLDGSGDQTEVIVAGGSREFVGVGAWMSLTELQRLRGRGAEINQLQLTIEPGARSEVLALLQQRPLVAGVSERQAMLDAFHDTIGRTFLTYTLFISLLGGVIAFGVIYNTVRISLAERGRELASLRVIGYRPSEVDHILLGELAILLLVGIPLGWLVGQQLSWLLVRLMESELYRIPLLFPPQTLALSATVVIVSAILSGMVAVRRVAKLDLIEVLKTRE
jgi:putative ABC transport system permease protein